ncbi:MAG: hypothetical protein F8N37_06970 [Telmatospirillum sp.]|nr:hypothetical protein [Telmatospirillum sp.]
MPPATPHLLVSLTAHGFGHAAMTAPVVNDLRRRLPDLNVTLQSDHPAEWLATRFEGPFRHIPGPGDAGLRMASATRILLDESAELYRDGHRDFARRVSDLSDLYRDLRADLLFANIPYVALAAAARIGLPAVAMSCLNWADLYGHYFSDRPEAAGIEAAMLDAYRSASVFLCPAPSMPMPRFANARPIGPVAPQGTAGRAEVRRRIGLREGDRLGLIAFGGVDPCLDAGRWARLPGWFWLTNGDRAGRRDMIALTTGDVGFTDLMKAADVVVTKPGYGTFTEAAVNGTPVLYLPRPDWPESEGLIRWLDAEGRCRAISLQDLYDGDRLNEQLQLLFSSSVKPLVSPTGVEEAVREILPRLSGGSRLHK